MLQEPSAGTASQYASRRHNANARDNTSIVVHLQLLIFVN